MNIKYGDIEYFELLSLQDKLKNRRLDLLGLLSLDRLRTEIAYKVEAIKEIEKERINNRQKQKQ